MCNLLFLQFTYFAFVPSFEQLTNFPLYFIFFTFTFSSSSLSKIKKIEQFFGTQRITQEYRHSWERCNQRCGFSQISLKKLINFGKSFKRTQFSWVVLPCVSGILKSLSWLWLFVFRLKSVCQVLAPKCFAHIKNIDNWYKNS